MRTALVTILALVFLIAGTPAWLAGTDTPYLTRALSYSLFHANVFHLAVNSLALWSVFSPKRNDNVRNFLTAYIIAVIVYPLSFRPVIGFSNILYAMLGQRTPALSSSWWKTPQVKMFIIVTLALAVIPSIAATTHIAAFVIGCIIAYCRRLLKALDNDLKRADR